ncbi:MAG TPA: Gfo/Idh/MocA family oxidoreductase [Chthonomonadales bacterium]|nr:Gfo/Idh/MocA family oxidoreductase [Chthonomonadales bacterium]
MSRVRLGILGVSWWTDVVWPGFAQAENAEITWIASRTGEKAEKFACEHNIPHWSSDYREVLTAPDVDAVFVGVPNFLHEEMAIAAIANGKHVLQEKPMALSYEKAVAQAEVAASRKRVLMINQEVRLANGVSSLPQIISERVGPLRKLVIGVTLAPAQWGGWRGDPALSGGTLFEMAIHQLDLARWLFGRNPRSVWAQGMDVSGNDMTVVFDYGGGDSAIIDYCWRCIGFRMRIEAYGARGYVIQDLELPFGDGRQTLVTEQGEERTEFPARVQGSETFKRVLEGFASAILEGKEPPVPAEDGVWAVYMAEAARESLHTGQKVSFRFVEDEIG